MGSYSKAVILNQSQFNMTRDRAVPVVQLTAVFDHFWDMP